MAGERASRYRQEVLTQPIFSTIESNGLEGNWLRANGLLAVENLQPGEARVYETVFHH